MNKLTVTKIIKYNNQVIIDYEVEGEWKKFFNVREKYFTEYERNIEDVPNSIAIIPFLSNVLPIVWVADGVVIIDEIDKTFNESIENIKKGYIGMFPNISFKGRVKSKKIINNEYEDTNKCLTFFSGGVDSFSTLISHIKEKPQLVTIWGSDIMLEDFVGWDIVKNQVIDVSNQFSISKNLIKTNFRTFINTSELSMLVEDKAKDNWWHGFQHGIGIIGQAAPIAYLEKCNKIYIAASYSIKNPVKPCASDPEIDNEFKFANCKVYHDQYELNRLEKIKIIADYAEENKKNLVIRVCWESTGGKNCCRCEKCYRTIYELLACGVDPNKYGFVYDATVNREIKKFIMFKKILPLPLRPFWKEIQDEFTKKSEEYKNNKEYKWIYKMNVKKGNNNFYKKIRAVLGKIKRKVKEKVFYKK